MTLASFVESRLERGYDYGAQGGPLFNTTVISVKSGKEWRNANWSSSRGHWQLGQRTINQTEKEYLIGFFRARRGRAVGFRWKDWADYQATGEALTLDGTPTTQLIKTYTDGGVDEVRNILKPVTGTVTVTRGGVSVSPSLDVTTGVLTWQADRSVTITSVSAASPAEITTSTAHGFSTGDTAYLTGTGISGLDGLPWPVTVIDTTHFTIAYDNSAGSAASSGTVAAYPQPGESVTWSGEFDVPVRFDGDQFDCTFQAADDAGNALFALGSLTVTEILL